MRIMIVEDDPSIRDLIKEFCVGFLGHEVMTFSNPTDALGNLEMFRPHLAIVDHYLPGFTGTELIKLIKATSPYCYTILISGTDRIAVAVQAMRAGCDNMVSKPFHIDEIVACINEAKYRANNVKSLNQLEEEHIENVVATSRTLEKAATKLGINTTTLWRKRKKKAA